MMNVLVTGGAGFHSEREYLRVDTIENRVRTLARVLQYL